MSCLVSLGYAGASSLMGLPARELRDKMAALSVLWNSLTFRKASNEPGESLSAAVSCVELGLFGIWFAFSHFQHDPRLGFPRWLFT
jgi:hypothetical protein